MCTLCYSRLAQLARKFASWIDFSPVWEYIPPGPRFLIRGKEFRESWWFPRPLPQPPSSPPSPIPFPLSSSRLPHPRAHLLLLPLPPANIRTEWADCARWAFILYFYVPMYALYRKSYYVQIIKIIGYGYKYILSVYCATVQQYMYSTVQ
jgi:hypothetical protein